MTEQNEVRILVDTSTTAQSRLIHISPEILELLESDIEKDHLQLKSAGPDEPTFLCSYSKTFQVRQISQSNTLLLLSPRNDSSLVATTLPGGYLELVDTSSSSSSSKPSLDFSCIPFYHDRYLLQASSMQSLESRQLSLSQFQSRSPVSPVEFRQAWVENLGVEIDGFAYRLSHQLVSQLIPIVFAAVQADELDLDNLFLNDVVRSVHQVDDDEPVQVIETILSRFSHLPAQEPYRFDRDQLTKWLGITVLADMAAFDDVKLADFMTAWGASLPTFLDTSCNLALLTGQYVQLEPELIRFLPSSRLPDDPATRFERLFAIKSSWHVDEIIPFLTEITQDRAKINTLFMKFAKKKIIKGKTYYGKRSI
ncbi:sister chromatid cohesion protein Dcc1 [Lipomyces japonicus]|uniref:sister chromatid cohesion protein Dcc1 n=1 Tax=Lipomyces japonicus TaxID=56871 RepID=UPI0034CEFAF2